VITLSPTASLGRDRAGATAGTEPDQGEVDVDSPLDRAVAATRRAIWPLNRLDPAGSS
jgi:hypothetical protein